MILLFFSISPFFFFFFFCRIHIFELCFPLFKKKNITFSYVESQQVFNIEKMFVFTPRYYYSINLLIFGQLLTFQRIYINLPLKTVTDHIAHRVISK